MRINLSRKGFSSEIFAKGGVGRRKLNANSKYVSTFNKGSASEMLCFVISKLWDWLIVLFGGGTR